MLYRLMSITALLIQIGMCSSGQAKDIWKIGLGTRSCSFWTPAREAEANGFISGFWSATNQMAEQFNHDGSIGFTTDTAGIVEEVRLVCRQNPSLPLINAVQAVYKKIGDRETGALKGK